MLFGGVVPRAMTWECVPTIFSTVYG